MTESLSNWNHAWRNRGYQGNQCTLLAQDNYTKVRYASTARISSSKPSDCFWILRFYISSIRFFVVSLFCLKLKLKRWETFFVYAYSAHGECLKNLTCRVGRIRCSDSSLDVSGSSWNLRKELVTTVIMITLPACVPADQGKYES